MHVERFSDFDEFASSVCGVDSRMLMRAPERASWTIHHLPLCGINIQLGQLGSGNIACGTVRPDTCIFYLPLSEDVEYVGNGEVVTESTCVQIEPGAEFCISTKHRHDWVAAFVPRQLLSDSVRASFTRSCRVRDPGEPVIHSLRTLLKEVVTASTVEESFESSIAASNASRDLLELVTRVAETKSESGTKSEGRPPMSRVEVVDQAMAFIEKCPNESVRVSEMASAASVSERTLRTIFQEFFGVGPVEYLQTRKLNEIHRALKTADAERCKVTQVLADHGVWAFGRFAARYRAMFGEPPSETLRRRG